MFKDTCNDSLMNKYGILRLNSCDIIQVLHHNCKLTSDNVMNIVCNLCGEGADLTMFCVG